MKCSFLFKGDNLEVLKSLQKTHTNVVKCVYLDPPYNTGVNREHFKDDLDSNNWIQMMRERLIILKSLMRDDASLWISIDDSELGNLRNLCDEIFGKENFLATVTWQHKIKWEGYKGKFQLDHTYVLCYRKTDAFNFENNMKPKTVWLEAELGGQKTAIEESADLFGKDNVFSTPKPESLLRYIIELSTKPNEIVLDGFSGSGTTGAVAEKMGRRWIMMEIGNQCETHILTRMNKITKRFDPKELLVINELDNLDGFIYFSSILQYEALN